MSILLLLILVLLLTASCGEWKNDLVLYEPEGVNLNTGAAVDDQGQLYNMSFDLWSKEDGYDVCYGAGASDEQKSVWSSPNKTTASMGKPSCVPESEFVAVSGEGKYAMKLRTNMINALVIKRLAAGSAFTGQMGTVKISKLTATLKWGVPFNRRPKSLEGYACYKPCKTNVTKPPYECREGVMDSAHVFVVLADWDRQFTVDPSTNTELDIDNDPGIIGYGRIGYNHAMDGYEKFVIDIEYRNERTPRYVVIVASSSAYGDYYTGGEGSTLYLDEFRFNY